MDAYMSAGDDRNKTRFYFADATAQGYLEEKTKFTNEQRFYDTLKKYLDDFNNVIKLIILSFFHKIKGDGVSQVRQFFYVNLHKHV